MVAAAVSEVVEADHHHQVDQVDQEQEAHRTATSLPHTVQERRKFLAFMLVYTSARATSLLTEHALHRHTTMMSLHFIQSATIFSFWRCSCKRQPRRCWGWKTLYHRTWQFIRRSSSWWRHSSPSLHRTRLWLVWFHTILSFYVLADILYWLPIRKLLL